MIQLTTSFDSEYQPDNQLKLRVQSLKEALANMIYSEKKFQS